MSVASQEILWAMMPRREASSILAKAVGNQPVKLLAPQRRRKRTKRRRLAPAQEVAAVEAAVRPVKDCKAALEAWAAGSAHK